MITTEQLNEDLTEEQMAMLPDVYRFIRDNQNRRKEAIMEDLRKHYAEEDLRAILKVILLAA